MPSLLRGAAAAVARAGAHTSRLRRALSSPATSLPPPPPPPHFAPHLDYKALADRADYVRANIAARKANGDVDVVVERYRGYVRLLQQANGLRAQRKALASERGRPTPERVEAGRVVKDALSRLEVELTAAKTALDAAAVDLPCDSHPLSPVGPESAAVVVGLHGAPPTFAFPPRDHMELGRRLGLFDFASSAATSGSGFVTLRGDGVLLELALVQWALSRAVAAGFTPIAPPELVHPALVEACGFNPRSGGSAADGTPLASQVYSCGGSGSGLALIGTSEIPLAGLHADAILDSGALPALYCAVSHCFRREASSGGARDRGLYRLHQFTKVELFAFVAPAATPTPLLDVSTGPTSAAPIVSAEEGGGGTRPNARTGSTATPSVGGGTPPDATSEAMLARLLALQISMFSELGLHFRVLDMPTEELGAAAYRKYDIEAWMPCRGEAREGAFGEISSASNCIDYQARRLNIRARATPQAAPAFVHTLNATACAVPRMMLALLETHQREDGSVDIPPALRPFLGGRERLTGGGAGGAPARADSNGADT